jgi:signal transduction histidine kinase/CHASE2 domain-containing sensor protein
VSEKMKLLWNNWKTSILSGGFLALILLLFWGIGAFSQLNLTLSNAYFIPSPTSDSIVIVAIDDSSLAEYGRTPAEWTRDLFGQLAEVVAENNARVIAYDLIFSETTEADDAFAQALTTARQSDARTRIVLSGAGVQQPSNQLTLEGFSNGLNYSSVLLPNPTLEAAADYVGYVNAFPDVDGRLRRQPSIIQLNDQLNFSFSLTVFFAQRRIPTAAIAQLVTENGNQIQLADSISLTVDDRGLWLQNFFGTPYIPQAKTTFPIISFRDVMEGQFDNNLFDDKIVLVGLIDSLGATDQYLAPPSNSGALMSGVEIQANAIETLLSDMALVPQSAPSQALMIFGLSVISSLIFNRPRWYWKILIWFIVVLVFLVLAFLLFTTQYQVVNLFYGLLAISLPALWTIGLEISREITRRRQTEFLLQSVVSISEQRMMIDNILPIIAQDVQTLISDSVGLIRIYNPDNESAPKDYRWNMPLTDHTLNDLTQRAKKNQSIQHEGNQLAVPLVWQGQTLGIIVTQAKDSIATQQVKLVQNLAKQLAPSINNLSLHRSIDQQNRLLELILRSSPTSIIVVDHRHTILRANQQFAHWLLKNDPDELREASLFDLLKTRVNDEQVLDDITTKLNDSQSFELQVKDTENHALRMSAVPLSEHGHWVILLIDISDLVQLNELRTQMIRMASHDLKNPLSRVLGYAEIIATSGILDEMNERFMQNIMNAGDEINQIITDILDLEQLRAGQVERKPASFKNLVREIYQRHEPDKDRKSQTMSLEMIDAPITVDADYLRLGQAVSNLIGNAIKYTQEEGTIVVRVIQPDPDFVQLEVEDNGYGIPEASQERLFTEFYRVKTKSTRGISGTGLGLSLVKSVTEAHDGDVWVKSTEGEGSTFYMKLPVSKSDIGDFL